MAVNHPTSAAGSGNLYPQATTQPPAIGQHWAEANGIYAGPVVSPDGRVAGLAWANDLAFLGNMPWGEYGQGVEGADSLADGLANTQAMAAAGSALAKAVLGNGAYIPSRIEALQLFAALKDQLAGGAAWTSTQFSANYAWYQYFLNGYQDTYSKDCELRAVPVRRLFLCSFDSPAPVASQEGGAA